MAQILNGIAPDGKPWREDVLHALGASTVQVENDAIVVDPEVNISLYVAAAEKVDAARMTEIAAAFRRERNIRLAACDWTQMPDAALSSKQIAAWRVYRKALRDLPENTPDVTAPAWPVSPEK